MDGYDIQMQTNHLSHFLLTSELFDNIKKSILPKENKKKIKVSALSMFRYATFYDIILLIGTSSFTFVNLSLIS